VRASELDYHLPDELIAKHPADQRDQSRLLIVASDGITHSRTCEWPELIEPGSVVVLNESQVIKARLRGRRTKTGGRVEILLLRPTEPRLGLESPVWEALGRANRPLRVGASIEVGRIGIRVIARGAGGALLVELRAPGSIEEALRFEGSVPIPPYLGREEVADDEHRYQTVYAQHPGSVAAPTAGLHLTEAMLARLVARGVVVGRLSLHVGMGTFRPVVVEDLSDHPMHREHYSIGDGLVAAIDRARQAGAPVIAVGTTVVRALESAAQPGQGSAVRVGEGETRLLIQPGFEFRVVDGLLTNFHQPRSTLLALVGAFAGMNRIRDAYRVAVQERYRFLSYGDAMWIPRRA
jgi:S-adenosylmethionine:tRNA ribosyltransferase-isomerase